MLYIFVSNVVYPVLSYFLCNIDAKHLVQNRWFVNCIHRYRTLTLAHLFLSHFLLISIPYLTLPYLPKIFIFFYEPKYLLYSRKGQGEIITIIEIGASTQEAPNSWKGFCSIPVVFKCRSFSHYMLSHLCICWISFLFCFVQITLGLVINYPVISCRWEKYC